MQDKYLERFLKALQEKGLALDTNMWILLIVGEYDPTQISKDNLTEKYSETEYEYLLELVKKSKNKEIIVGSYLLPEISHQLKIETNRIKEGKYRDKPKYLETALKQILRANEIHMPAKNIIGTNEQQHIARFGFSDLSVVEIAKEGYAIVTDDIQLCDYIQKTNLAAISMQAIRGIKEQLYYR